MPHACVSLRKVYKLIVPAGSHFDFLVVDFLERPLLAVGREEIFIKKKNVLFFSVRR